MNKNRKAIKKIKNLKDLEYQHRLLTSRMDQQEVLISYQIRNMIHQFSPTKLLYTGLGNLVVNHPKWSFLYKLLNLGRKINIRK
ncbi:MAG: hypothetical protein WC140_06765 [Bacteroidales bacterium]